MRGKQRKQMLDEKYKVKYGAVADRLGTQLVLLPLSYGALSLVLLDMIASLLQEQNVTHKGRQGFNLVVLHIAGQGISHQDKFNEIREKYAPVDIKYLEKSLDDYPVSSRMKLAVSAAAEVQAVPEENTATVSALLAACASRSLQEDLRDIVMEEIVLDTASSEQCQTVLYGHSMTRLAVQVIADTVKGRGLAIHASVANRTLSHNGTDLTVIFPLRDILFAEIKEVLALSEGLSQHAQPNEPTLRLTRNMTVHDLTRQYFDTLDATGYASTASTVVKTAEKLGGPRGPATATCRVCGADIHQNPRQWLQNITVTDAAPIDTAEEQAYVDEYTQSVSASPTGQLLEVCYGCTVALGGAGPIVWPVRATKQEILDEYVLE